MKRWLLATFFVYHSWAAASEWGFARIEALRAQQIGTAENPVVVAIIDTGADLTHPELATHAWVNPGESGIDEFGRAKATNGIDDDGNGLIDDVNGWNFARAKRDFSDDHGHGTHVAGIVARVAPDARLMILKYHDPGIAEGKAVDSTIQAIHYAVKMKADIINYSAGGGSPSAAEKAAIAWAQKQGVLFVAAAGNEGSDADKRRFYPAGYELSNILSVAAIGSDDRLLPSSNYGVKTATLAAPGSAIVSAAPGGRSAKLTGTSQAAAFASGAAALLLAREGKLAPERLIEILTNSGDYNAALSEKTAAPVLLNAFRALAIRGPDRIRRSENAFALDPALFSSDADLPAWQNGATARRPALHSVLGSALGSAFDSGPRD